MFHCYLNYYNINFVKKKMFFLILKKKKKNTNNNDHHYFMSKNNNKITILIFMSMCGTSAWKNGNPYKYRTNTSLSTRDATNYSLLHH